jgi:PQQ enzyme-like repeat protein
MNARSLTHRAAAPSRRRSLRWLRHRTVATAVLAVCAAFWMSTTAFAQLDPLLFIKRVPPTIIVVFDTSMRMLEDGSGNWYDPNFYRVADDLAVMPAFPSINPAATKTYRRVYRNLQLVSSGGKYTADSIAATPAVWDPANALTSNHPADLLFLNSTRYNIAKQGLSAAVAENASSTFRWGLIKLRQNTPAWRTGANCDQPVLSSDATQLLYRDNNPCSASGGAGNYAIYPPRVAAANFSQSSAPAGTVVVVPAANTANTITTILARGPNDSAALIPASMPGVGYADRPLDFALTDARSAAISAMASDSAANRTCRNTVVVLITGGKDSGDNTYAASHNAATTASSFLSVSGGGVTKRVPIVVVAVRPAAGDVASLQSIATNSGGQYFSASTAFDVTAAVDRAVQWGFARSTDFDSGTTSEFNPVSPIVGTVNLKNAKDANGNALPNTDITANPGGQPLQQRSNFLLTGGFTLPGFDGVLRAFRTYKPVADSTKPTGWKFVNDGTRLWPDLDGRPSLAGKARIPADPNTRNIYTFIPNGSGGGSMIPFTVANAATLGPHMQTNATTASLIAAIRAQPMGALIGSTPAIMDVPSLDPPPDDDYGRADVPTSFAGMHKDRRALIFVGANDGMIHAIDARTGYEVWAFIPYNLLPKLKTFRDGQAVDQFDYFVDSSPKIAEVKLNGVWKSLLLIGEGPGGTFYQTFDVTEAGMGVDPSLDDLGAVNAMLSQFDTPNESIVFKWAFPSYDSFDPTYSATFTVFDGTPGGKQRMYGDLKATASFAEKTVGFTWSDPAIGALKADRSVTAVIVGSGYFPDIEASIPNRGVTAPKAGNAMYLLDANTGTLLGNSAGSSCATIASGSGTGTGCVIIGDVAANGVKNALQADPTAAGESGSVAVSKAYVGDLDGRYWRFNFDSAGQITVNEMVDTGQPIYASSALLFVGTTDVYMFFATGSDLLPSSAPGGTATFKLYGLKDNAPAAGATTKFAVDLAKVTNSGGLATGERPSTSPSVAGDIVFYTTTTENAGTPCADFSSNLYAMTYAGGAAYDTDNNGKIDNNESTIAKTMSGRATAPFIVDQHLYTGTSGASGARVEAFGDPEDFNNGIGQVGVRILSWREIR